MRNKTFILVAILILVSVYTWNRFRLWSKKPISDYTVSELLEEVIPTETTSTVPEPPKHHFRCFYDGDMIDDYIGSEALTQFSQVSGVYRVEGQNDVYYLNSTCFAMESKHP